MFVRIENNIVVEIFNGDVLPEFHPSLIWLSAPDGTREGYVYDGSNFADPETLITGEEKKTALVEYINKYRQEIELVPIDVNGITIKGDETTRAALVETITFLEKQAPAINIDWEAENGFVSLDVAGIITLGEAVAYRRQKSFTVKKAISLAIELGQILTEDAAKTAFDAGMAS